MLSKYRAIRILVPVPAEASHLHIPRVRSGIPRMVGKLAVHAQHLLGEPQPQQRDRLDDAVHDQARDRDAHDVGRDAAAAMLVRVEEVVRVEALGGVRQVRQREVQREHEDEPPHVDPGGERRARDEDLEEREAAVQRVLADVGEGVELLGEPRAAVQQPPVHGGHDERVHGHRRVEEGVQRLEGPWPAVEERRAGARVAERVRGGHEEVEGEPPVRQVREVAERVARLGAPAELGRVRAVVGDLGEVDGERVEALVEDRVLVCGVRLLRMVHHRGIEDTLCGTCPSGGSCMRKANSTHE